MTNPTSARFVPVGPVRMHPPCFAKKDDESFSFKKRAISVMLQDYASSIIYCSSVFCISINTVVPIDADNASHVFLFIQGMSNVTLVL